MYVDRVLPREQSCKNDIGFGRHSANENCYQRQHLVWACSFAKAESGKVVGKSLAYSVVVQSCDGVSRNASAPHELVFVVSLVFTGQNYRP